MIAIDLPGHGSTPTAPGSDSFDGLAASLERSLLKHSLAKVDLVGSSLGGRLVRNLAAAPMQEGPAAPGSGRIAIGWGRHDRLCWPAQAERALAAFPGGRLHWFEQSGHFPAWDEPDNTVRLISETLAQ